MIINFVIYLIFKIPHYNNNTPVKRSSRSQCIDLNLNPNLKAPISDYALV